MTSEVFLIAGLPGCGKTTYLGQLCRDGWLVFDDFKIGTDALRFRTSPRFQNVIDALRQNGGCAVADIDFCRTEARDEAEHGLRTEVPGVKLNWLFFENDPVACELNIRNRNRDCFEQEICYLRKYSPAYRIPHGASKLPVWQKSADGIMPELAAENCS